MNEVAVVLLVARDEYYLRCALRGASRFGGRDARRARWHDELVRTGGHHAAARVFRELVMDAPSHISPQPTPTPFSTLASSLSTT